MAIDLDALLIDAVGQGASDIHLKPGAAPVLRVYGHLVAQHALDPITREDMASVARRVLPERMQARLAEGHEVDLAYHMDGHGRFRVNMFLAGGAVRAVLRAIPTLVPTFEALGLPPVLARLAMESRGMILVTGVTGSGKSTTLAAMIDHINRRRNTHIVTIEDPIEFVHEDVRCVVSQREVGHDSPSFATALRAALRQDPDVILVGEMRDEETMATALHAAETGHLVLSTLHTLNATETVNRIIGTFPPHREQQIRDQLAAVLQGIVSQRLVASTDGRRVAAVEVLVTTGLIRDCIREPKRTQEIPVAVAAGTSQYGMQTFDQGLLALYHAGKVSRETAREAATNPDDFDLKVRGILSTSDMTLVSPGAGKTGAEPAPPADARSEAAPVSPRSPFLRQS